MQHTNLEIWDASNFGVPYIVADNDVTIAHFYGENAYENAKALVASKGMYEVGEKILRKLKHPTESVSALDAQELEDALNKAKGESQ